MTGTRLLAGVVGLLIILPLVFFAGFGGTALVVGVALAIATDEYAKMAFPDHPRRAHLGLYAGTVALSLPVVFPDALGGDGLLAVVSGGIVVLAGVVVTLWPGEQLEGAADRFGRVLLGVLWCGLLVFLMRLRLLDDGITWVMLALGISWAADTGAYFAGRTFGRTKLYPRVSPNKTWEGFAGGIGGSVLWVAATEWVAFGSVSWLDVAVMAPIASAFGVLGDLTQSMVKRSHGVKDMGNLLPGHGGIMDRIDSVLFVAPVVWSWHIVLYGG